MDVAKPAPWPEPAIELDALAKGVLDAAFEVHRTLGPGLLERHYEEALCHELDLRGVRFERQVGIALRYKGHPIAEARVDLLVGGALLVELKAVEALIAIHRAQVLTYLAASNLHLGLLINFNSVLLRHGVRRVILNHRNRRQKPHRFFRSATALPSFRRTLGRQGRRRTAKLASEKSLVRLAISSSLGVVATGFLPS